MYEEQWAKQRVIRNGLRKLLHEGPFELVTKEWVSSTWKEIQENKTDHNCDEYANQSEIYLTRLVLKAIGAGKCVHPEECASIVQDFCCYPI